MDINIRETKKRIKKAGGTQTDYFRQKGINPMSASSMLTDRYFEKWYPPKPGGELHFLLQTLQKDKLLVFMPGHRTIKLFKTRQCCTPCGS